MLLPPGAIVKTSLPAIVAPELPMTPRDGPPMTVIWPPFGKVSKETLAGNEGLPFIMPTGI
jgi:hypothetical protein